MNPKRGVQTRRPAFGPDGADGPREPVSVSVEDARPRSVSIPRSTGSEAVKAKPAAQPTVPAMQRPDLGQDAARRQTRPSQLLEAVEPREGSDPRFVA